MDLKAHGGDLLGMAAISGRDPSLLLDFSVNVRPEGPPEFLRRAILEAVPRLAAYPSPQAGEALAAAARRHGLPAEHFAFGNGSNELIHALARVLKKGASPCAFIIEPTFSEYQLACGLAGLEVKHVPGGITRENGTNAWTAHARGGVPGFAHAPLAASSAHELLDQLSAASAGSAVFLANPGNPSGLFRKPDECLRLIAARPDLTWVIDEAFIEYAGPEAEVSILRRKAVNAIVLRSLTKFHALPGVRMGYLAASPTLARAVRDELPAWNLNAFAIAASVAALDDASDFAEQTRAQNNERRADLMAALSALPGLELFPSAANYVLLRCRHAPPGLRDILLRRFGIAVRDCSNYHGLEDGTWYRVAVRFPEEHRRLASALRQVLAQGAQTCG